LLAFRPTGASDDAHNECAEDGQERVTTLSAQLEVE